jgi:tellurite resistance protein
MSFLRTLATLAVGFAAARGVDKYRKAGGMDAMKDMMRNAGAPGGIADQMGEMAEKLGIPGGKDQVRKMVDQMGDNAARATEMGQSGLEGLIAAAKSAAVAGSGALEQMIGSVTKGTPVPVAMEENAKLMIRAMIMAAKADGEIDEGERKRIMEHLKDATAEEREFVMTELAAPIDVAGLAAQTGETARAQVYATALMAAGSDKPAEAAFLRQLAQALMLDDAARDALHAQMGVPPLPMA